jgi:hypothetical protein|tara:strand:- start:102 stop:947 length:846 start_codon:yes stop_codon:yes gene_type:complete
MFTYSTVSCSGNAKVKSAEAILNLSYGELLSFTEGGYVAEWMDELRELDKLRADSLITEEEYEKQKALLIPSKSNATTTYNLLGLGKAVSIVAGLSSVVGLLSLIAFSNRASLLTDIKNGNFVSWSDGDNADTFVGAVIAFEFLIGIPLFVLLIIWAWRATLNIEAQGHSGRWSRGWAIGGWFTPVMFLFVPYQVISDAWKNASDEEEIDSARNNFWLAGFALWWVAVAFGVLGNITNADIDSSIDDAILGDIFYAINGAISLIAGILIAVAFNQMSKRHA